MSELREALADWGVEPGNDVAHSIQAERYICPAEYEERAAELIDGVVVDVLPQLRGELHNYADKRNPGGFMVFPLGVHSELGQGRLHIYPAIPEIRNAQGPNIHDHAWHLYSRVIELDNEAPYTDAIFELQTVEEESSDGPVHRLYRTHRRPGGRDVLVAEAVVDPIKVEDRIIPPGGSHFIEAGAYHLPTVPETDTVVTLVWDSHRFRDTTGVVFIDKPSEMERHRVALSAGDIILAENILDTAQLKMSQ